MQKCAKINVVLLSGVACINWDSPAVQHSYVAASVACLCLHYTYLSNTTDCYFVPDATHAELNEYLAIYLYGKLALLRPKEASRYFIGDTEGCFKWL